jgi:hypothetical protein
MGAATATLRASMDVQPALSAQGLQTGVDMNIGPSVFTTALAVNSRRAFNFTLALTGNNQVISFGDIAAGAGTVLMVSASAPVTIAITVPGAGATYSMQYLLMMIPKPAGGWSGCTITALSNATTVDVVLAG